MLEPQFLDTLRLIDERLKDPPVPWAVTGSVGMVLQGMALSPHDLDLQSDEDGAREIERRLGEFVTQPLFRKETERMCCWLGRMEINGLQVEILGDSQKRGPDGQWRPPTDMPAVTHFAAAYGMRLPVLSLNYEADAYDQMGRVEKARLIQGWVDAHPELTAAVNYRLVAPGFGSSGQPTPNEIDLIAREGYQALINLAMPDSPEAYPEEPEFAREAGLEYIHIPVVWEQPTRGDLEQFFRLLDDHAGKRVFVHCIKNFRVSAFLYLYRVLRLGVSPEAARRDLLAVWQPNPVWQAFIDTMGG